MTHRWAIHIDIVGFSALYPKSDNPLWALNRLMLAVHSIGKMVYPREPHRLFAHQIGDGFLILSDFHEPDLERAASIAIVLMKFIAGFGLFARATIAEGNLADITGCYSETVLNDRCEEDNKTVMMGSGLMTLFPVMGTALINAVRIDKRTSKGPILAVPDEFRSRLPGHIISKKLEDKDMPNIAIDWVHTESELITKIKVEAQLDFPCPKDLEILLSKYITKNEQLPGEWVQSCRKYMGVRIA